jgi:hypothetical protein
VIPQRLFSGQMNQVAAQDFSQQLQNWETMNRTSLQFTLSEAHGVLNKAINILTSNQINMTRIVSKPSKFVQNNWREVDFFVDIEGSPNDPNVLKAIKELELVANRVHEVGTPEVPWFPTRIEDFDFIGKRVLGEGDGIQEVDHPAFRDKEYIARRQYIAQLALDYRMNDASIPQVIYNENEMGVWKYCYPKLKAMLKTNACDETNQTISDMEANVQGFGEHEIP